MIVTKYNAEIEHFLWIKIYKKTKIFLSISAQWDKI